MVFLTIVSSGLPLAISKQIATKQSRGVIPAGLILGLTASSLLCLFVLGMRNLFGALFTDTRCTAILITLIPAVIAGSVYSVIRAVWWGEKRFFLLGITELLEQILRIIVFVVMLAFAFFFTDLSHIAALSYTVACALAAVFVAVIYSMTKKIDSSHAAQTIQIPYSKAIRRQFKPLLKSALPIAGVRVAASITMPVISVLVPMRLIAAGWAPSAAVAGFGVLVGMTLPLFTIPQTVISSLATALVPELSSAHKNKKNESITRQIQNSLKFTLFINFLLLPVFIAVGEEIGEFLYSDSTSGIFLSKYAWVMIPMSLSQITNAILNSLGAETRAMKNYFIGSFALFGAIWFLPSVIGIGSLIIGMGSCMGIASILNLLLISKILKQNAERANSIHITNYATSVIQQCLIFLAVSAPAILSGALLQGIFRHIFPLFISLGLSGAGAMGVFAGLCHAFEIIDISGFFTQKNKSCAK
jgi:stage V sporulation protein B